MYLSVSLEAYLETCNIWTQCGLNKMVDRLQATFSNPFFLSRIILNAIYHNFRKRERTVMWHNTGAVGIFIRTTIHLWVMTAECFCDRCATNSGRSVSPAAGCPRIIVYSLADGVKCTREQAVRYCATRANLSGAEHVELIQCLDVGIATW